MGKRRAVSCSEPSGQTSPQHSGFRRFLWLSPLFVASVTFCGVRHFLWLLSLFYVSMFMVKCVARWCVQLIKCSKFIFAQFSKSTHKNSDLPSY
uniref:Uncharacterized protein n=1 Tax=Ciona savignyi TaxID=51511 RepID=H2YPY3_CIOSA